MGDHRWDPSDYKDHTVKLKSKSRDAVFKSRSINKDMDPHGVKMRESCDSKSNPNSNPIIVGLDVTGSMGMIAENLAKEGLGVLLEEIYKRKPVTDPHVMMMGIGDANFDEAPLQIGQFEAGVKESTHWLESIWLEGRGGGNSYESYDLPYYFAAFHTSIDSYKKRGEKGFIFTMGDEMPPKDVVPFLVEKVIGDKIQPMSFADLLTITGKSWNCFHIIVKEGSHAQYHYDTVNKAWIDLLGQNVLTLPKWQKVSELIVSTLEICSGKDLDTVVNSWDGDTSLVIREALKDMEPAKVGSTGVVRL